MWQAYQLVIVEWVGFLVVLIMVGIRLYVQKEVIRIRPWGEFWVVVALLLYLTSIICYTIEVPAGFFVHLDWNSPDYNDYNHIADKVGYVNLFVYLHTVYACKASLLCFYSELAPRGNPIFRKTRIAIIVAWVFVALSVTGGVLWYLLQCVGHPFSYNWSSGDCPHISKQSAFNWSNHLFTDLLIYTIPFFIIRKLGTLNRAQKIQAGFLFGFGLLNIILAASALAFKMVGWYTDDVQTSITVLGGFLFTHQLQQSTAIMIVCLPYVRKYVIGLGPVSGWYSKFQAKCGPKTGPGSTIEVFSSAPTAAAICAKTQTSEKTAFESLPLEEKGSFSRSEDDVDKTY